MREIRAKIGYGGRVALPAKFRSALGVKPGDEVVLVLDDHEVRVLTPAEAVRRAQSLVKKYARGRSLSGELLRDRRAEAKGE